MIVSMIDFRYIDDAITKDEALAVLSASQPTMDERIRILESEGYPAYTTSVGWFGFSDEEIRRLCR